jgi:2-polyprenyl-3-methyl-5-hydroxy-6-metoxy-1,4-benzoquinol methylase
VSDPEALKRFEAEGWNERADSYGLLTGHVTAQVGEALLDAVAAGRDHAVVDVACGHGDLMAMAAARGASASGIDLAEGMVEAARSAHPGLQFRVGDAEDLPFDDASQEAVVGGFILNHLPHPGRCAAECARILRPGGRVAFAVWDRPERARLVALLGDAIDRAGGDRTAGVPEGPDDFRFADPAEMRALLEGAGLEEVRVQTHELSIEVEGADALWAGLMGGLVRAPTAVQAQDPDTRARVREAFGAIAEEFRVPGGGLSVPAAVVLGAGRRRAA